MFQLPELGLLSLAMAIPLISGGINLAIIATANQAGLLMAWILTALMPPDAGGTALALWLAGALAAGLLLCVVVGLVTGLMVAVLGVHPILVTLGTMTLLHGFSIYLTRGRTLSGFPDALVAISNETLTRRADLLPALPGRGLLVHILLSRSPLGVRIHMIGSNLEATRFSGVDTRRVQVSVYLISSLLCWLAAVVMMARFNSAGADIAQSYLLDHHSRRDPRRRGPLWRLRARDRPLPRALHPSGGRQRLQPDGPQPAPRAGVLGSWSCCW